MGCKSTTTCLNQQQQQQQQQKQKQQECNCDSSKKCVDFSVGEPAEEESQEVLCGKLEKLMIVNDESSVIENMIGKMVVDYLGYKDVGRMMQVCKSWQRLLLGFEVRLDKFLSPQSLNFYKSNFKGNKQWSIRGVRLLDSLPGRSLFSLVEPKKLVYLQLSCLCLRLKKGVKFSMYLSKLEKLESLKIDDMLQLETLEEIECLSGTLKELSIRGCPYLRDISSIGSLTKLTSLELIDCRLIESINCVKNLGNLSNIVLHGLDRLVDIVSPLLHCASLSEMKVSRCGMVDDLDGLECLGLKKLQIEQLPSLDQIPSLFNDSLELETVKLSSCPNLKCILPLESFTSIIHLDISNTFITNVDCLSFCSRLETLDLSLCQKLKSIQQVVNCSELKAISLWKCRSLQSLYPLRACGKLDWVNVTGIRCSLSPIEHIEYVILEENTSVFQHREIYFM